MTTAICFKCGSFKFGSLCPCDKCHAEPISEDEIARSLFMTDRYFDENTLKEMGGRIASGKTIELDSNTLKIVSKSLKGYRKKSWFRFW